MSASSSKFIDYGIAPSAEDVDGWLLELGWTRSVMGTSVQGRDLVAYELPLYNAGSEGPPTTPEATVLFMSLTHANEPMGLISLLATVDLLSGSSKPTAARIVVFPFVNIDAYTLNIQASFGDRRTNLSNCNYTCQSGVDLNRNFANDWYDSSTTGGYDYGGSNHAFSEPETRAVQRVVQAYNVTHAMSFHSTRSNIRPRLLIHPFTSERTMKEMSPERESHYRSWSQTMNNEHHYRTGTAQEAIDYSAIGSSIDWMDSKGIYAFVLEGVPPCSSRWCASNIQDAHKEGRLNAETASRFVQLASGEASLFVQPESVEGSLYIEEESVGLFIFIMLVVCGIVALIIPRWRKKLTTIAEESEVPTETELQSLTDIEKHQ